MVGYNHSCYSYYPLTKHSGFFKFVLARVASRLRHHDNEMAQSAARLRPWLAQSCQSGIPLPESEKPFFCLDVRFTKLVSG